MHRSSLILWQILKNRIESKLRNPSSNFKRTFPSKKNVSCLERIKYRLLEENNVASIVFDFMENFKKLRTNSLSFAFKRTFSSKAFNEKYRLSEKNDVASIVFDFVENFKKSNRNYAIPCRVSNARFLPRS